jgi:hypothetical protein
MDLIGRKAAGGAFTFSSLASSPMEALVHSHVSSSHHREADTVKPKLRDVLAGQTIRHTEVLGWEVSLGGQYR